MTRNKNYANGTVATIGNIVLMKWSKNWWSAWDGKSRVWAESALRAYRLAQS